MDFTTKLSRLCWHRGWSQRELAEALGEVSKSTVSNWMTGKTDPRRAELARLARLFDVSIQYLVLDELEEPGGDGLTEIQRRILWAAETVGHEEALRRIMKAPGPSSAGDSPAPAASSKEAAIHAGAAEDSRRADPKRPRKRRPRK